MEDSSYRLGRRFPAANGGVAATAVILAAFVGLTVAMVGLGILVVHVLAHGSVGVWDQQVGRWLPAHGSGTWTELSAVFTFLGDAVAVIVITAVVAVVLFLRRWRRETLLLVAGLILEFTVFLTASAIVRRPRPELRHLGGTPPTLSYPSGHTAAAVVLYGGIAVLVTAATTRRLPRVLAWVLAGALTVAVGHSRIYRGEHHMTDVVAGALLGAAALTAAVFAIRTANAAGIVRSRGGRHGSAPARGVHDRVPERR